MGAGRPVISVYVSPYCCGKTGNTGPIKWVSLWSVKRYWQTHCHCALVTDWLSFQINFLTHNFKTPATLSWVKILITIMQEIGRRISAIIEDRYSRETVFLFQRLSSVALQMGNASNAFSFLGTFPQDWSAVAVINSSSYKLLSFWHCAGKR